MRTTLIFILFASLPTWARTFPEGFQWCVATAGHQVEGDNIHSDWWAFEQEPGRIKNGDKSGKAAYHMERIEEDVRIMKDLGVKTYRFSMEWARIEPAQGKFDDAAIAHYRRVLSLLKKAGIEPMVTIHHFVSPQWFAALGGFENPQAPEFFERYTKKLEQEFGGEVTYWITFNEPTVLLLEGYGEGFFPPGKNRWNLWEPALLILKSHALSYRALHEGAKARGREIKVGFAHHLRPISSPQWWLRRPIEYANFLLNWNLLEALQTGELRGFTWKGWSWLRIPWLVKANLPEIKNTQDFLGVNYYTRESIWVALSSPFLRRDPYSHTKSASELNWGVDPEGFYEVLEKAHKLYPDLPFFITENGLADAKDQWRGEYLTSHLAQLHRAMTELPHKIEGYCHWSLLDNFEWHEGFKPRFGLFEVDYANGGKRIPRPSASVARRIFKSNSLN